MITFGLVSFLIWLELELSRCRCKQEDRSSESMMADFLIWKIVEARINPLCFRHRQKRKYLIEARCVSLMALSFPSSWVPWQTQTFLVVLTWSQLVTPLDPAVQEQLMMTSDWLPLPPTELATSLGLASLSLQVGQNK